ncbi:MAG: hypothetical protein EA398_15090 [Deltaproteobacteria bacterium]|nr:MAG: hypothetical protein EA398_15090 [Deltaproteobacteria bacterium]
MRTDEHDPVTPQPPPPHPLRVAFVRLEGVLSPRSALAATAWIAGNGQTIGQRLTGLAHAAALSPARGLLHALDGALTTRVTHAALRGLSEDRIHILAEEYVDDFLRPSLREDALDRLRALRRTHDRIVLLAETIAPVVESLRDDLRGIDDVLCNHLEFRNGRATGRLLEPLVGGAATARLAREHAATLGAPLEHTTALAAHAGDTLLLAAVGHPVAIAPDPLLHRTATTAGWPIERLAD